MITTASSNSNPAKQAKSSSAFKTLFNELLSNQGDYNKLPDNLKRAKIRCQVRETYPKLLISDGSFFIAGYITKECQNKCEQKKVKITDLKDGLILITKWNVELTLVNSAEEFTSYSGIEMRVIIHEFRVNQEEDLKMSKFPTNLYRDDEVKASILHFIQAQRLQQLNNLVAQDKEISLGTILAKPKTKTELNESLLRSNNVISLSGKKVDVSADCDQFTDFGFDKAKRTPVLTMQEIFIAEKGAEALRKLNINLQVQRQKDEPQHAKGKRQTTQDLQNDQGQDEISVGKVKKSLTVSKPKETGISKLKVTTTFLKDEPKPKKTGKANKTKAIAKKGGKKIVKVVRKLKTKIASGVKGKTQKRAVKLVSKKDQSSTKLTVSKLRKMLEEAEAAENAKKSQKAQPARTTRSGKASAVQTPSKKK
eukprot:403366519